MFGISSIKQYGLLTTTMPCRIKPCRDKINFQLVTAIHNTIIQERVRILLEKHMTQQLKQHIHGTQFGSFYSDATTKPKMHHLSCCLLASSVFMHLYEHRHVVMHWYVSMYAWTKEWMNEWMNEWLIEWLDRWNESMKWIDEMKRLNERTRNTCMSVCMHASAKFIGYYNFPKKQKQAHGSHQKNLPCVDVSSCSRRRATNPQSCGRCRVCWKVSPLAAVVPTWKDGSMVGKLWSFSKGSMLMNWI